MIVDLGFSLQIVKVVAGTTDSIAAFLATGASPKGTRPLPQL